MDKARIHPGATPSPAAAAEGNLWHCPDGQAGGNGADAILDCTERGGICSTPFSAAARL